MQDQFITRFFKKPPIVFPLVALYHIFLLGLHLYHTRDYLTGQLPMLETLWYVVAVVFMIFICDLRRWAALGYIVLTIAGLLMQFKLPAGNVWHQVGASALFPFDLLITVFLLFYYKRFR